MILLIRHSETYINQNELKNAVRYYLSKLLDELDRVYPKPLTVGMLHKKEITDDFIAEAVQRELVVYPAYKPNSLPLGTDDRISISIKGLELLNQIKIKEAVE